MASGIGLSDDMNADVSHYDTGDKPFKKQRENREIQDRADFKEAWDATWAIWSRRKSQVENNWGIMNAQERSDASARETQRNGRLSKLKRDEYRDLPEALESVWPIIWKRRLHRYNPAITSWQEVEEEQRKREKHWVDLITSIRTAGAQFEAEIARWDHDFEERRRRLQRSGPSSHSSRR